MDLANIIGVLPIAPRLTQGLQFDTAGRMLNSISISDRRFLIWVSFSRLFAGKSYNCNPVALLNMLLDESNLPTTLSFLLQDQLYDECQAIKGQLVVPVDTPMLINGSKALEDAHKKMIQGLTTQLNWYVNFNRRFDYFLLIRHVEQILTNILLASEVFMTTETYIVLAGQIAEDISSFSIAIFGPQPDGMLVSFEGNDQRHMGYVD